MAKSANRKSAAAIRTRDAGKPETLIATLTTLAAIVAFAVRHVTSDNAAALIGLVRDTFRASQPNRNVGRTTGHGIMHFQNTLIPAMFAHNPRPTLVQLTFIGAAEFPNAVGTIFAPTNPATGTIDVGRALSAWDGCIRDINRGTHGAGQIAPSVPCVFDDGMERRRRRSVPATVPASVPASVPATAGRLVKTRKSA